MRQIRQVVYRHICGGKREEKVLFAVNLNGVIDNRGILYLYIWARHQKHSSLASGFEIEYLGLYIM